MEDQKELTFGGKAVGLTFNPSAITEVDEIKRAAAQFIDVVCGPNGEKLDFGQGKDNEAASMRKLAERAAQEAQMWAVKAATWNLPKSTPESSPQSDTAERVAGEQHDKLTPKQST